MLPDVLAPRDTARPPVVLVADDEPSMRLLVSATMSSEPYEVVQAQDGDEAWDILEQRQPEIALLDVQMPGRTGLDLTRAIKADPRLAATQVILLTSKAQEADFALGRAAGADFYLTKPFSPLELLDTVQQALSR